MTTDPPPTTFRRYGLAFSYLTEVDLPDIVAMLAKASVCEHVFFGPNTEAETRAYFEPLVESIRASLLKGDRPAEQVFTIRGDGGREDGDDRNGEFLGQCALLPIDFCPDNHLLGLTVDDMHWRKGIGEKACRFLVEYAFQILNARRISGDCMEGNVGSRRIMEKCGFAFEGRREKYWCKNGIVRDNLLFGLVREHAMRNCTDFATRQENCDAEK